MAQTPSTMLDLGTPLHDFSLPDTDGDDQSRMVSTTDFKNAPALLVMFLSNHCPFVKHVADELAKLTAEYMERGVAVVAVSSNDVSKYPADGEREMRAEKALRNYRFPYLYDESQAVAKQFRAACTPDFYVFDERRLLVYRGQMDASRPGNGIAVTGSDLRAALAAVLSGKAVDSTQRPSIGCNIKWKKGQEPDYF